MNTPIMNSSSFLLHLMKRRSYYSAVTSTIRSKYSTTSAHYYQKFGLDCPPSLIVNSKHSSARIFHRCYHSFPDPKEKPVITTHFSTANRQLEKTTLDLSLNNNFKMNSPYPNYETYANTYIKDVNPNTFSTILKNGLTIASEDRYSLMTTLTFVVKTGSSYETKDNFGVTHLLEMNAFKSNSKRSASELSSHIENLGGMVQCITTRENIFYCLEILRENVEQGVDILADNFFLSTYPDEEIAEAQSVISWQYSELPGNILSRDAAQVAAYKNSPLSNDLYCPIDRIPSLNADMIKTFKKEQFYGSNCVIAGAGIDHATLVKLVEKKFSQLPALPPSAATTAATAIDIASTRKPSVYTGGLSVNERELKEPFTRVCLAFECGGWADPSLVPLCVMQVLLGGGSSFSAGGPGKGMYTRLYREVLNQNYWVESAESFIAPHDQSGIFGIDGSCTSEYIPQLIKVIIHELTRLAVEPVTDEELSRAKNMLKSLMMMQLESRMVLCEDLARQFITYGHRKQPADLCLQIDRVTKQDLLDVSRKMLMTKPSVGIVGPEHSLANKVPKYEDIENYATFYRDDYFRRNRL